MTAKMKSRFSFLRLSCICGVLALALLMASCRPPQTPTTGHARSSDVDRPVRDEATGVKPVPGSDVWWVYQMAGKPVGYIHESSSAEAGGTVTTVESLVVIGRLDSKVELQSKAAYVESEDGKLKEVRSESKVSEQTNTIRAEVQVDGVKVTTTSAGKQYDRVLAYQGKLIGPEAVRRLSVSNLKASGDSISYQMFVPELESIRKITRTVIAPKTADQIPDGKDLLTVEESIEDFPSKRTLWLDKDGRVVRHQEPGPLGQVELIRSNQQIALDAAKSNSLPPDMFAQSLIHSGIRLPSPRSLSRIVLKLTLKDSSRGWPDLKGDSQKVLDRGKESLRLEVRQVTVEKPAKIPSAVTSEMREYLDPNAVIQSDDLTVRKIASEIVGSETDTYRAARKLQSWVSDNMNFDAGITLATAAEVAKNRRGTCMSYSVLLAALARSAGIPSRVVIGYVYTSGIWGGHAWVEVMVGERWVPLDGAIPGPGPTDAARFGCVRTSCTRGLIVEMGGLLQLFSNLAISIEEYEVGGQVVRVPATAKPCIVEGNKYQNPWLGISLEKPSSFAFIDLDAVYPDSTVVAIQGPKKEVVRLRQESASTTGAESEAMKSRLMELVPEGAEVEINVAGKTAIGRSGPRKAALAFVDGTDLWILSAEGMEAATLLKETAGRFCLTGRQGKSKR
jgi:hypothetical protein